jgi:hypothetical protein
MASGAVFTISWDTPGLHEGIWMRQVLIGSVVVPEANVATWDVSRAGRWDRFVGHSVSAVQLHYKPWSEGYWCSRVTLTVRGCDIELLLGEGWAADNELHHSANNIAVLFPPAALPAWESP